MNSRAETDDEQRPDQPRRREEEPRSHSDIFSDSEVNVRRKRGHRQQRPLSTSYASNHPGVPTLETANETDYDENEEDIPPATDPYSQEQRHYHHRGGRGGRNLYTPMTIPIPERNFMEDHNSYHGAISGEEAVKRLSSTDTDSYLSRFSSGNRKYVLTILKHKARKVSHFRLAIDRSSQRKYKVEGMENHFESIDELLGFYENNRIHPEFDNIGRRLTVQDYPLIPKRRCILQ